MIAMTLYTQLMVPYLKRMALFNIMNRVLKVCQILFDRFLHCIISNESSPYNRPRSSKEAFIVRLLLDICCDISVYQDLFLSSSADDQAAF